MKLLMVDDDNDDDDDDFWFSFSCHDPCKVAYHIIILNTYEGEIGKITVVQTRR